MRQKFFTKCVGFLFKKCDSFFHNILTILLPKAIVITKCVCTFRTFNPYSTTIKIFLEVYIFGRFKSLNEKNALPSIWDFVLVTLTDASSRGQCVFWQTLAKNHDYLDLTGIDLMKRRHRRVSECGIEEFDKSSTFYKKLFLKSSIRKLSIYR